MKNTEKRRKAKCIAIFGTGSDVGKSIVVAALCRIFSDLGVRVAPFKAQNMSNNSYVTPEGGEMGRAQIVQAEAARVAPHVDMNPVLLKPSTDTGSQVVLYGQPLGNREAKEYFSDTDYLHQKALASLERLRTLYSLIVMEGAGSCAEVNLHARDFVNFRMAHAANAPVILVADIDRGGVFAQVIGTLNIIPAEDRRRVAGIIINRFRGDPDLFRTGIDFIEKETHLPVLGLVPYFHHIQIDSEDGLPLDFLIDPPSGPEPGKVNIGVIRLPHISNFTDFNPFQSDAFVNLHYLARPRTLYGYEAIFIPGTKNSRFDMEWLAHAGWATQLAKFVDDGGLLIGICGGYQILGKLIRDPYGVEGNPGETHCLGFLDVETTLHADKILSRSKGVWEQSGEEVKGYEIHMGLTERGRSMKPLIRIVSRNERQAEGFDGAATQDDRVWGTYFHGLFDEAPFRHSFLKSLCGDYKPDESYRSNASTPDWKDHQYDLLAEHFRLHLDMKKLFQIAGVDKETSRPRVSI